MKKLLVGIARRPVLSVFLLAVAISLIIINLSGRGDKDVASMSAHLGSDRS